MLKMVTTLASYNKNVLMEIFELELSTMQTGKRGKIKNLKKITALLKLHCKHGQAALTSEKKKSYASITSVLRLTCRGLQWISASR